MICPLPEVAFAPNCQSVLVLVIRLALANRVLLIGGSLVAYIEVSYIRSDMPIKLRTPGAWMRATARLAPLKQRCSASSRIHSHPHCRVPSRCDLSVGPFGAHRSRAANLSQHLGMLLSKGWSHPEGSDQVFYPARPLLIEVIEPAPLL